MIAFAIIHDFKLFQKEHDHTFLESLQNCCREWFNERDKLLRSPFLTSHGTAAPGLRRWTAYVSFLTELYLRVKSQHCQVVQTSESGSTSVQVIGPHPNSPMAHLALTLQTLLFECANIVLKPPALTNEGEVNSSFLELVVSNNFFRTFLIIDLEIW